jgi:biopolymer transport protein ExbD
MRRRPRQVPGLNTAALPDLIFTVLFFFMIVTHMRDVDLKVRYDEPQGRELQKLEHKSAVTHIYIGRSLNQKEQTDTFFIQLNNKLATVEDIRAFLEEERNSMSSEDQARMTVSIRADRDVPMGIISDVKRALQQSLALRINYSAVEAVSSRPPHFSNQISE